MRRLRVSIDAVWVAVAVALPALGALLAPLTTEDLAYQVRTGDLIIASRSIPSVDTFTFSAAGAPWTVQQWAAATALAAGFAPAGWAGLLVLRAVLVAIVFGLVVLAGARMGVRSRTAAVLAIAAFVVALGGLALRAQLFGILCFAAILALVAGRSRSPRAFLLVPLVVLAWANVHGTFVLGLAAVAWALLEDLAAERGPVGRDTAGAGRGNAAVGGRPAGSWRRDVLVLALSVVATFITPFGPGVWAYVADVVATPAVAGLVSEWQPTTVHTFVGLAFAVSAVAVGAVLARRSRGVTWPTLIWLAALFALGAWAERGVVWWALGAAVAVAGVIGRANLEAVSRAESASRAEAVSAVPRPTRRANGVLALVILAAPLVLALAILARPSDPVTGRAGILVDAPPGITAAVREVASPGTRILNAQRWGSWLEWAVPEALVYTDSRFEVIPADAWRDHVALSGGRFDWAAILDRIAPDLIVASRDEQKGLLDAIVADPAVDWRQVYADADGVVLRRWGGGTGAVPRVDGAVPPRAGWYPRKP